MSLPGAQFRTKAVEGGLQLVRNHGGTMARCANDTVSSHASVVGYAYGRGSEAVQQEFDAYIEALHAWTPSGTKY